MGQGWYSQNVCNLEKGNDVLDGDDIRSGDDSMSMLSWFTFKDFAAEDFPYEQILSLLSGLLSLFLGFDTVWR